MSARRRVLLGLVGLLLPGLALAQPSRPAPAKPVPAAKAKPAGTPAARMQAKAAGRTGRPSAKPPAEAVPTARPRRAPSSPPQAEPAPRLRPAVRAREEGPGLRPLDREMVQNWLQANPDWSSPPGPALPVAVGKPLPAGLPRPPLPPGLAMLLPYFPGYRYAALGPDLVLYASGTEVVASALPGALAR